MSSPRRPSPGNPNAQQQVTYTTTTHTTHQTTANNDNDANYGNDRIANLENQMAMLMGQLEAERSRHKQESMMSDTKIRLLESQLRESGVNNTNQRRTASSTPSRRPQTRDMAPSTPRTSDALFVAVPNKSSTEKPPQQQQRSASSTVTRRPVTRTGVGAGKRPISGKAGSRSVAQKADASSESKDASPAKKKMSDERATALQHSWDKFCVLARNEFSTKELALVSAETLQSLLDFYHIHSPIERAQIEAQWALLQEGKTSVGATATPRAMPAKKRPPLQRAAHSGGFDTTAAPPKPHLSRRLLLQPEDPKPSNPNESTSKSGLVRSHSHLVILRERVPGTGNPLDTEDQQRTPRLCFARSASHAPAKERDRGMAHVPGPASGEYTPRGIRTDMNKTPTDGTRPESIRCGNFGDHAGDNGGRGIRTGFDKTSSPTHRHRNSKIVTTPPHLERSHLLTDTLGQDKRWARGVTSPRQRAIPFAVDN